MRGLVIALALMFVTTGAFANQERIDALTEEAQKLQSQLQQALQVTEQIKQRLIGISAIVNEYNQQNKVIQQLGLAEEE